MLRVSQKTAVEVSVGYIHFWDLVFFQAQVVGRIHFPVVVEWRAPFSCWLAVRSKKLSAP